MKYFLLILFLPVVSESLAQDTISRKRTIDITSTFKPSLRTPDKIAFAASPALADTQRNVQPYRTNVQSLALNYEPASLRPLAYAADTITTGNNIFIKAGFGNFKAPYLKAIAGFGAGKPVNGSAYGNVHGGEGKLPFQKFGVFGAGADVYAAAGTNNLAEGGIKITGINTYRYGYGEKIVQPSGDSLKVKYTDVALHGGIANSVANEAGINYRSRLNVQHFADNNSGKETGIGALLMLRKTVGERFDVELGADGRFSKFSHDDTSFNNSMLMLPIGINIRPTEFLSVKAGLIPSWNNKEFKVLPNIEASFARAGTPFIFEAGLRGRLLPVSYRQLAMQNWWVAAPVEGLTNTRLNELFAAMKSTAGNNFSWRVAASLGKLYNVPLFINDAVDGKSFIIAMEDELSRVSLTGEMAYRLGSRINWSGALEINSYTGLKKYEKAYGLLPFSLKSGIEFKLMEALRLHADIYSFNGAWYRTPSGDNKRAKSAADMNAGLDFTVTQKLKAWVSLHNLFNQSYERWNQYPVLGFQVMGGVILQL